MEISLKRLNVLSCHLQSDESMNNVQQNNCNNKNTSDLIITTSFPNGCTMITLNKPKSLNSLNLEMINELSNILESCRVDEAVKFIVLKGSGKSFCAGGDIAELYKAASKGDVNYPSQFFGSEYQLDCLIWKFPKPIISLWHGIVMGGGVGLSIGAKYRVTSHDCTFAMPETGIGFFPDVGASYFLSRGQLAKGFGLYMALTGARLTYHDLLATGIATHSISPSKLVGLEQSLTTSMDPVEIVLAHSCDQASPIQNIPHISCIERFFGGQPVSVERIIEELEKAGTAWSCSVAKTLSQKSPSSLKVVLRQISLGASWSLEQTFKMEYRIALHFMLSRDFVEGVRAVIISKDNKPLWSPSLLKDISEEAVENYFNPLDNIPDLQLS